MIRSDNQKKRAILIAAVLLMALLMAATAPASATKPIRVDKKVYDPDSGEWVKALTAELNDTVQFKCTINGSGFNLTQVRFWDIMDCSLRYQLFSLKIDGNSTPIYDDCAFYRFKPKVLHPDNPDWDISNPSGSYFTQLCPWEYQWRIDDWEDHDHDLNVSAGDQILLNDSKPDSEYWFHVDRVPYTLNLSNGMYFDSELNWDELNLSYLVGTEWLEVCCCKDRYTLTGKTVNGGTTVTLRNERTGEVVVSTVQEIAKDLVVSHEYELDDILEPPFVLAPGQTITIEYNATVVRCGVDNNTFRAKGDSNLSEEGEWWEYSNEDTVTITVPCLEVDKTVKDPDSGEWVKELTAQINDTLQFTSTITNIGDYNFTQLRFWDIMDCSLQYQKGSLKIDDDEVRFCDWLYRFKPHVLHPHLTSNWDLSAPEGKEFVELCPKVLVWTIRDWVDHDGDHNVSACDQVLLDDSDEDSEYWFHVDRVPYTLILDDGCAIWFFDSELNWDEMDLMYPINSTWLEVCGCKDRYTLIDWDYEGCPVGGIEKGDNVTLRNERTLEEVEYTVEEEVAKDLVVSREYEIEGEGPVTLGPGEMITITYNATVVRCGVDNNTFRAKGDSNLSEEGERWEYSTEDTVTITVPCAAPTGNATDPTGLSKEVYAETEPVYAVGSGFEANKSVDIYILPFMTLVGGENLTALKIVGPVAVTTNENGEIEPVLVWSDPTPGRYWMVFDDPDGDYDPGVDPLDDFAVIGKLPVFTPPGIIALIGLLGIVAISTLVKKRRE